MSQRIRLREYAGNAGGLVVDRENGVIRGVKVLGSFSLNSHGVGSVSGTDYPLETRKAACSLYEGCKVNVDHPSRATPGADRSAQDRVGWLANVAARPDGTFADLHLLKSDPFSAKLFEAAERNPSLFGLSHNALGEGEVRGDRYVVTSIPEVFSVDVVADAGSVRGLHESMLREEKDASGHEHAADGKFGSGGGSSGKTRGKGKGKGKKASPAAPTKLGEEHVDELAGKLAGAKSPHEARQIMKQYDGKYDSGDATDALFDSGALKFDEDNEKLSVADPKKLKDLLTKHATGNKGDGHGILKDSRKRRPPMAGKTLIEALEAIGFKGKRVKKLLEMDGLDGSMPLDEQPEPEETAEDEIEGGYEFHIGQLVLGILNDSTLDLKAKKAKIEQALDLIDDASPPPDVEPALEGEDAMAGDGDGEGDEDDPKETKESLRRRVKALEAREALRELCESEDFVPTKIQMKALVVLNESDRKAFIAEAKGSGKASTDKGNANRNAPRTSVRESASAKDSSPEEIRARLFS